MADLLSPRDRPSLRDLLAGPGPLVAPGAYDALSARLVEQAGFDVVYMTGFGTTAGLLGRPDVGLLSAAEMVDNARRMVAAVDVPVIADGDTGYGNAINVIRTVQSYEQAGVAAIQLEDQVTPKKCGHMAGKEIVSLPEMLGKIRAAVDARRDLLVIARTDAVAVEGLDAAVERAKAFADAGADLLFVEAPTSEEDIEEVASRLAGVGPLVFNWAEGGKTPPLSLERIRELGFSLVLYPIGTLLAATAGIRGVLETLRKEGTPVSALPGLPAFDEFTDLVGLKEIGTLEQRYR
ncbi:isocitrate lyase/PEP mutase family protein [Pseudonocardia xishanensis]|uniref:Isocitrate lyase/PEP mutase family protein n=1 Tax=Pseudonocardia xishanensis TaxID=630995 RepID=A0ABP8S442_9PSEU